MLRLDDTISVDASEALWTDVFAIRFTASRRKTADHPTPTDRRPPSAMVETLRIPEAYDGVIDDVLFVEAPDLF